jgi:small subunit ribosomal protein S20
MANTKSAARQARVALRRRDRNRSTKLGMKQLEKQFRKLVADKKTDEATALLPKVVSALAKGNKRGVLHKNTLARRSSRLAKSIKPKA